MNWLNKFFDKLFTLLPEVFIVAPFEAGVRMTFGKYVCAKSAGWYLIWPLIQRFVWMEIQSQVVDLRNQSIVTLDGHDIVVSGAIQYSIKDIEKAVLAVQVVDKAVETLALGIILEYVHNSRLEDLSDTEKLRSEIIKGIREAARGWGVKVERVFITDLGKTRNLRLLTNTVQLNE
jgi:regulator of protease activity HflC (stomatin/prohibitin superfamily)